ncbi:hypothetical protein [Amycolatopsis alba]|uniref:hypothetical protein n=1 Tax=Amycolatopsis alba TaxID=76020 RepID=UPI0011779B3E|nr:hypothetical protein [Amycolatopsis alba]
MEDHLRGDAEAKGISASLHYSGVPARLPIPVRIWIEDEADSETVQEAVRELLEESGFAVSRAYPPQVGSWRRSFVYRLRRVGTSKELRRRLDKVERGIELQLLIKNQAEVDQAQGDAVAKLLASLQNTPTALIQIGSILLVKVDGVPHVRNLTQDEIALLDSNPSLLDNPEVALSALNDAVGPLRGPNRVLAAEVDSEESSAAD